MADIVRLVTGTDIFDLKNVNESRNQISRLGLITA
ncbi:hypothetical protein PM8797T_25181 [Gimesia maris DSM 8797]|nr:hypothetical protein PM8797T_25181 [Gimesia maris DSM 8797]